MEPSIAQPSETSIFPPLSAAKPPPPAFAPAKLRWGGQEWDIEVCGLERHEKGGRCLKQIAAQLTIPWRWEPQLIVMEAVDVAEIKIGDGDWETVEIVYCEVASFPDKQELAPGSWSTEFSAFRWIHRKAT